MAKRKYLDETGIGVIKEILDEDYTLTAGAGIEISEDNVIGLNGENISNPNLLVNGWFGKGVINQRGYTVYDETMPNECYTIDRWKRTSSEIILTLVDDGIKMPPTNSSSLIQYFEDISLLDGKTLTASIIINGITYSTTFVLNAANGWTLIEMYDCGWRMAYDGNGGNYFYFSNKTGSADDVVSAVKLELGSVATPFVPPDPATELAKCQRYYQVIDVTKRPSTNTSKSFGRYGGAITGGSTSLMITVPIAPMRIPPTLSITGSIDVRSISGYVADGLSLDGCTVTTDYLPYAHSIDLMISKTDGSQWGTLGNTPEVLKNNTPINLEFKGDTILSFSAEL